jgi:hypothetical protein
VALSALVLRPQAAAPGESARIWIGHEAAMETHLRTATVESVEDIGTGVTHPRRAHLLPSSPFASLVWKVLPPGKRSGHWESYKSEIAAYELDKQLQLGMIPPAVEREIGRDTGAAIMWLEGVHSVKELGGKVPSGPAWDKPIRKMLTFDNVIGNPDRNAGNILIGQPGELILIDHSRAFTTSRDLPRKVERVDGELWDRITSVAPADLSSTLKPWMDAEAVSAVLSRRERMIAEVEKLVKKNGAARVIVR